MDGNLPVICRACGRQVRMSQVKFDSDRKAYVCNSCHSAAHPSMAPISRASRREEPKVPVTKKGEVLIKYACRSCKYKFSRLKGKEVVKCPYCGGSKLEEISNEASKILADADRYNF